MPARPLRPRQRLRTGAQFDAVFKRGRRLERPLFLLVVAPNGLTIDRVGLAVSRRVGGAVTRNRVRRLLRESFRRLGPPAGPAVDLVVVARAAVAARSQVEVEHELREGIERARRAAQPRGAGPAPAR